MQVATLLLLGGSNFGPFHFIVERETEDREVKDMLVPVGVFSPYKYGRLIFLTCDWA